MTYSVRTTVAADQQIRLARDWWRSERPAAPFLFEDELGHAFSLLEEGPQIGVRLGRREFEGMRRVLLPKTRYHVYYQPDETQRVILVLAVWSAVRGRGPRLRLP